MSAAPREVIEIIESCKQNTAQYREALALAKQAEALSPQLSIWSSVQDDLASACLDAERRAANSIIQHGRRVLGPQGLPLPADAFADLLPDQIGRHERRARALQSLSHPSDEPMLLDLDALWPSMLSRFPTEEAAHAAARTDLAKRFRELFFCRRYPAPEPHRDGLKLKVRASQDSYSWQAPAYCRYSSEQLCLGIDMIAAIGEDAGLHVAVDGVHAWQRERPYFAHQKLDAGPVQVVCRKDYFELQIGRDLARAINLFLAAHAPHVAGAA